MFHDRERTIVLPVPGLYVQCVGVRQINIQIVNE